jgi:hypothetical protein
MEEAQLQGNQAMIVMATAVTEMIRENKKSNIKN